MTLLLLIFAYIIIVNLPGLIKRKEWKELAFSLLYVIAFALGLMYVLDIPIPSPMEGLQHFFVDILGIEYPQG